MGGADDDDDSDDGLPVVKTRKGKRRKSGVDDLDIMKFAQTFAFKQHAKENDQNDTENKDEQPEETAANDDEDGTEDKKNDDAKEKEEEIEAVDKDETVEDNVQ